MMEGSLDNPPITIMMSRGKMAGLLLVAVAFTALGIWMVADNDFLGYLCAGFFGSGIVVFIWQLRSPKRLEISAQGVSWFTGRSTQVYAWKDFAGFRAYRPSSRAITKHVGFEYAPDCPKRGKMTAVTHAMAGVDGSFGGQWEMPTQSLVDLLNEAKKKWG